MNINGFAVFVEIDGENEIISFDLTEAPTKDAAAALVSEVLGGEVRLVLPTADVSLETV